MMQLDGEEGAALTLALMRASEANYVESGNCGKVGKRIEATRHFLYATECSRLRQEIERASATITHQLRIEDADRQIILSAVRWAIMAIERRHAAWRRDGRPDSALVELVKLREVWRAVERKLRKP